MTLRNVEITIQRNSNGIQFASCEGVFEKELPPIEEIPLISLGQGDYQRNFFDKDFKREGVMPLILCR